jgi:hypothetical protein
VREPAMSCTTCGAALLPAEVLYTPQADVVCAACFGGLPVGDAAKVGPAGELVAAVRTAHSRRASILRWSLLFAILATSVLQVRHFALIRLHMICPRVSIDAPTAGDTVSPHLFVRGHVASDAVTRPVWIIARAVAAHRGCRDDQVRPIVPGPFGAFGVGLHLEGGRGERYLLEVVSADEVANAWLEVRPAAPDRCRRFEKEQVGLTDCSLWSPALPRLPSGPAVLASMVVVLSDGAPSRQVGSPPCKLLNRD